ncbi:hypothetical protein GCM10009733_030790 [Nonomuraea maheshkhaliensis]|uniref:Uncharacterized protein n=1 Tax=Nonomuraea maheshkhaliensis TaxID=419590 RepID=A0ABP4R610_9ACTN
MDPCGVLHGPVIRPTIAQTSGKGISVPDRRRNPAPARTESSRARHGDSASGAANHGRTDVTDALEATSYAQPVLTFALDIGETTVHDDRYWTSWADWLDIPTAPSRSRTRSGCWRRLKVRGSGCGAAGHDLTPPEPGRPAARLVEDRVDGEQQADAFQRQSQGARREGEHDGRAGQARRRGRADH